MMEINQNQLNSSISFISNNNWQHNVLIISSLSTAHFNTLIPSTWVYKLWNYYRVTIIKKQDAERLTASFMLNWTSFFTRELAKDDYAGVKVRVTLARTW